MGRNRRIGYLSPSQRGARHDKRLCDQRQIISYIPPKVLLLGDSAFQGWCHPGLGLPVKGSKKHPLTDEQRQWNTLLASQRVVVEHCIGGMKRYQAVAGVYRNRRPKTDDRFHLLAAGLWHFALN